MEELDKCKIIYKNGDYFKLKPPDGGWGYVIAFVYIIALATVLVPAPMFPLIFDSFLVEIRADSSHVGLLTGISMFVTSLSAFAATIPLKRYSYRQVAFVGAVIYTIGWFACIFMNSVFTMIFFNGIIVPMGTGVMFSTVIPSLSSYFDKKRGLMMSFCQMVIGIITVLAPTIFNMSVKTFGFRGTLIALFIQSFILIIAISLLRPVENYMVLVKLTAPELDAAKDKVPLKSEENIKTTHKVKDDNPINKISKCERVIKFMGLDIFKDICIVNLCVGTSVAIASDMTFNMFLPLHLYETQWNKDDVALLLSLNAFGDLAGRTILVLVMHFLSIKSRYIFFFGVIMTTALRAGIPYISGTIALFSLASVLGTMKAMMITAQPIVVAERVPHEKFATTNGMIVLIVGAVGIAIGPIIGFLKDTTGSYVWPFNVLTLLMFTCVIPWTIELSCTNRRSQT